MLRITSIRHLELRHVDAQAVTYRGCHAIRLTVSNQSSGDVEAVAILPDSEFRDGTIETAIAGLPQAGAPEFARGFVGIAFRVQRDASAFEAFFLRPTNSRAEDQLRRNHSTQYMSHPDFPWFRLREESPGLYESYVDLSPGAWTPIRIVVQGATASLFVNRASQPCLIVNDLKLGHTQGQIALWIGAGSEAYFSRRLLIRRAC
jgi:hypothetical protein